MEVLIIDTVLLPAFVIYTNDTAPEIFINIKNASTVIPKIFMNVYPLDILFQIIFFILNPST